MVSPMYLGLLILLAVYTQTDALQLKGEEGAQCYQCRERWCEVVVHAPSRAPAAACPPDKPHCATVAAAPNFTSSLTCAAAADRPCVLTYTSQHSLEMLCTCQGHLCNAPFSKNLQEKLTIFVMKNNSTNVTDYTEDFFNEAGMSSNSTLLYETFTTELPEIETTTAVVKKAGMDKPILVVTSAGAPRAEALMYETTVPNEDDEDEGEGSGLEEAAAGARRPEDPAAEVPAAPSSHLPARDTAAAAALPLALAILPTTAIIIHAVI